MSSPAARFGSHQLPERSSQEDDGAGVGRLLSFWIRILVILTALGVMLPSVNGQSFASYLFFFQDFWILIGLIVLLVFIKWRGAPTALGDLLERVLSWRWSWAGGMLFAVVLARLGTDVVFHGVPVSGDESRADFDSMVIAGGSLAAKVPEDLRFVISPMRAIYFQEIPGDAAWVSTYLPGNAALRALARLSVGADWCSPLLAGLAVLAGYGVARQLWPERKDAAVLAAVLLATTPQVLVTAMTPFAMTAHLAVNLCWLWLFLKDRPASHAGALAAGFIGTGLHQYIFHPLFVLPFGVLLLVRRRWMLAALYAFAYAAFLLFWMRYPGWVRDAYALGEVSPSALTASVASWWSVVSSGGLMHDQIGTQTVLNLSRWIAWSSPAALLLLPAGLSSLLKGRPIELCLLAGLLLTVAISMAMIPAQGNGWGYRYAHGVLGSLVLLSVLAWARVTSGGGHVALSPVVGTLIAAGVLLQLPATMSFAARHAFPIVAAIGVIEGAPGDIVVVDDARLVNGMDLVRNKPDLSNKPWVLLLSRLDPDLMEKLCPGKSVAVFDAGRAERLGFMTTRDPLIETGGRRKDLERICRPSVL
jgi:hypothetical protein